MKLYAEAARQGDARRIYALLSERSQHELGLSGTQRLVQDAKGELAAQGQGLARADVVLEARAVIRYDDGETASLTLDSGRFWIDSAAALPLQPRTPAEALAELRRALARRSYAALVRLLSRDTQAALENQVGSLVEGLESPETLDVKADGDSAEVELSGGHWVKLKREAGIWHVEDVR
ncbi:MAG TPA: hypothetical protein VFQ61_00295 [Polyangiaceae bacterium]|nr:hypothetical protein [Polyangiaceae bacterium]